MQTPPSNEDRFLELGNDKGERTDVRLLCINANTLLQMTSLPDTDKGEWEVVTDKFQKFYEYWRESSTSSSFLKAAFYKLPLGVVPPFHPDSTSGN